MKLDEFAVGVGIEVEQPKLDLWTVNRLRALIVLLKMDSADSGSMAARLMQLDADDAPDRAARQAGHAGQNALHLMAMENLFDWLGLSPKANWED